jgi:hypothetical protein
MFRYQASCAWLAAGLVAGAQPALAHIVTVRTGGELQAAIADIPRLRASLPVTEPIEIRLPPGVIRLTAPLQFDAAHGGSAQAPLILRGADDGTSRLVGAMPLPVRAATAQDAGGMALPAGTLAVDLAAVPGDSGLIRRGAYAHAPQAGLELFQGSHWLSVSRWPAQGYATGAATAGDAGQGPLLTLPTAKAAAWGREPALWAQGYWGADWAYDMVPVASLNAGAARLGTMDGGPKVRPQVRFAIVNGISDLRNPGTFVVLPARHLALVVPLAGETGVEAAVAPMLIDMQGARGVTLTNLALDRARGTALHIQSSHDIRIVHCAIRQSGVSGAVVTGGDHVVFTDSVIASSAETGLLLDGGNRSTLQRGDHAFVNGIIADFGRESPSYRPGVNLTGVGNRVEGSLITGGQHNGVMVSGNDHQVLGNEISDLLRDADDSGAVYMGADWTQRGNVIAGNYIHDLGGTRPTGFLSSVYLDDQFSGVRVTGNVMVGGEYGVVIGGGRDNSIQGNLMLAPRLGAVHFDQRGQTTQKGQVPAFTGRMAVVPVHGALWSARYPALAGLDPAHFGMAQGNSVVDILSAGAPVLVADPPALAALVDQKGNRQVARAPLSTLVAQAGLTLAARGQALAGLQALRQVPETR